MEEEGFKGEWTEFLEIESERDLGTSPQWPDGPLLVRNGQWPSWASIDALQVCREVIDTHQWLQVLQNSRGMREQDKKSARATVRHSHQAEVRPRRFECKAFLSPLASSLPGATGVNRAVAMAAEPVNPMSAGWPHPYTHTHTHTSGSWETIL
ncbi:unnamed protein product [Leuciscus chuanchicus]